MPDEDKHHVKNDHVVTGGGGLKDKKQFSWVKMSMLAVVVAVVGGFFVWNSFAASGTQGIINTYYQTVIGKDADSSGLAYWTSKYDAAKTQDAKNAVIAQLVAQLKTTQAYQNRQAATSTTTPAATTPSTGTRSTGSSSTPSTTPASTSCTANTADNTTFVKGLYTKYLKYAADESGLKYWVGQLDTCVKTRAAAEAYFKSKSTTASTGSGSSSAAATAFPERKSGESDWAWGSRIVDWLQAENYRMTDGCCGGLGDARTWADRIISGKWTPQQVLAHLKTTGQAARYTEGMADPNSAFAQQQNARKAIQAAYMAVLEEYIANGGTPHTDPNNPIIKTNCAKELEDYKAGKSAWVFYTCFTDVGVNPLELENWIHVATVTKQLSVEEVAELVKQKATVSSCLNIYADTTATCSTGGQAVPYSEVEALKEKYGDPARPPKTAPTTTTRSDVPTSPTSTNSTIPNDAANENAVKKSQSPLASAVSKAKPVTDPSSAVNACTGSKCVALPTGNTKAADIKANQKLPTVQICDRSKYPTCTDYTENWNNGGSVNNIARPADATSVVTSEEVKTCVDQYATVKPGDNSACVEVARYYTGLAGYSTTTSDPAEYDAKLEAVVEDFQSDQKLSNKSGTVDKQTWEKLKQVSGKAQQSLKQIASNQQVAIAAGNEVQRSAYSRVYSKCDKQTDIKSGAKGDCVERAQQALEFVQVAGLPITGQFDTNTVTAVRQFQSAHGLKSTGVVNKQTWNLLEAAKDVTPYQSPYQAGSGRLVNSRQ